MSTADRARLLDFSDGRRHDHCSCCGTTEDLQSDHIEPRSQGGSDDASNREPLCGICNRAKGTGVACPLDHSKDFGNNSNTLAIVEPSKNSKNVKPSQASQQAESLVQFSTRVKLSTKEKFLEQAKARQVAAGVILDELAAGVSLEQILEVVLRIERNQQTIQAAPQRTSHVDRLMATRQPPAVPIVHEEPPPPTPQVKPSRWQTVFGWIFTSLR